MKEKHVIFVIHTLAIGGAERQIAGLANYLSVNGLNVTIVLLDDDIIQYDIYDKVNVVCLNSNTSDSTSGTKCIHYNAPSIYSVSLFDKIRLKLCKGNNKRVLEKYLYLMQHYVVKLNAYIKQYPDAVVVTNMLVPNTVGSLALKTLKNRFIFFDANSPEYGLEQDNPLLIFRDKYLYRANAAVFQTDVEKNYYGDKIKCEQYIIPNFIPTEKLPHRFKGTRKKEIVSFCRLSAVKNIPLLIKAFALFYENHPDYQLKIYGDGPEKGNIEALISEMKMESFAAVCPAVPDVHNHVVDASVFVSSSDREGLSNSMLEAMAIGLPSVCTDCIGGGARIIIEKYGSGILVPCNDAEAIAKAISDIVENRELSESLSEKGEAMAADLSIESVGNMWKSII